MKPKNLKEKIIDILKKQCKEDDCCIKIDKPANEILSLFKEEIDRWTLDRLPAFPPKDKIKEIFEIKLFSAKDIKEFLNKL